MTSSRIRAAIIAAIFMTVFCASADAAPPHHTHPVGAGDAALEFVESLNAKRPSHDVGHPMDDGLAALRVLAWLSDATKVASAEVVSVANHGQGSTVRLSVVGTASVGGGPSIPLPREWTLTLSQGKSRWRIHDVSVREQSVASRLLECPNWSQLSQSDDSLSVPFVIGFLYQRLSRLSFPINIGDVQSLGEILYAVVDDPASRTLIRSAVGCVRRWNGGYREAEEDGLVALEDATESRSADLIAIASLTLGQVYRSRRDYRNASIYLKVPGELYPQLHDKSTAVFGDLALGWVQRMMDEPAAAILTQRRAERRAVALGWEEGQLLAQTNIGLVYQDLNNYELAIPIFRSCLAKFESLHSGNNTWAKTNLAEAMAASDHTEEAIVMMRKMLASREFTDPAAQSALLSLLGRTLLNRGSIEEARVPISEAVRVAELSANGLVLVDALDVSTRLALDTRDYRQAELLARRERAIAADIPGYSFQAMVKLGQALRGVGDRAGAMKAIRAAIAMVETSSGERSADGLVRADYFSNKLEPFRELVDLLLEEGKTAEAFRVADGSHARALTAILARKKGATKLTDLEVRRQNELVADVSRANRAFLTRTGSLGRLTAALTRARLNLEDFNTRMALEHPSIGPKQDIDVTPFVEKLAHKTTVVEYLLFSNKLVIFVVAGDGGTVHTNVRVVKVEKRLLRKLVSTYVERLRNVDIRIDATGRELARYLILPIRDLLPSSGRVCIVPDSFLWRVPFHALPRRDGDFLADTLTVTYTPSVTFIATSGASPRHEISNVLAVGDPVVGASTVSILRTLEPGVRLGSLPDARREAEAVAALYRGQSRLLVGGAAREKTFKARAPEFSIIHLATHGVANERLPMFSSLLLATSPGDQDDGLLEAREILDLDLHAELVVFSACETAGGRVGEGEGVMGLSWAVLAAGVPRLVATQWETHSKSAADVMISLHRRLRRGASVDQALRDSAAQLRNSPRFRHPFFWAPFVLIGRPE